MLRGNKFHIRSFSIFLCVLLLSCSVFAVGINAQEIGEINLENLINEKVFSDVEGLLPDGDSITNYVVTESSSAISRSVNSAEKNYVLTKTEKVGEIVKVTTLFPYKGLENGDLVNSFQYAEQQMRNTDIRPFSSSLPITFPLVDVTISSIVEYEAIYSPTSWYTAYRPIGVSAYWSSSKYISYANNLTVRYDTGGDVHYISNWQNEYSPSPIQTDYIHRIWVDQDNPIEGSSYGNYGYPLASNKCIELANGIFSNGGMLVYVSLSYVYNGVSKTDDASRYVV